MKKRENKNKEGGDADAFQRGRKYIIVQERNLSLSCVIRALVKRHASLRKEGGTRMSYIMNNTLATKEGYC